MAMEDIREPVRRLKECMEEEAKIKSSLQEKKDEYELSIQADKESLKEIISDISDIKSEIEKIGVNSFKENGEKNLYGGVKVKETTVKYYDDEKAFSWAKEKGECLLLDKKAFEKVAPVLNLDFYKETKEPKVTFPKTIKLEE